MIRNDPPAVLTALLVDQHIRWHRGERVWVERYMEARPSLGDDSEILLDIIYHEIVLRSKRGDDPRIGEYFDRFPGLFVELGELFFSHRLIESLAA